VGVSLFGLTPAAVRENKFPQWNDFTAKSSPTSTQVTDIIEGQAGELAAKLYAENVVASSIPGTTDGNGLHSAAWLWCRETLRLMVALEILRVTTQRDPELAKTYAGQLKERLKDLDAKGATALGDAALDTGDAPAQGPTTHINTFGLTTLAAADMSSLDDVLKRSDKT
jgi:hypothetical protein